MGFNGTNIDEAARATPTERGGELRVTTAPLNTLGDYRYSVIFAQFNGQWLFCRHRDRQTWETPGGHIEAGETPLEAAKRELFEETGAADFEIYPAFDYDINFTDAAGQVFFAEVKTLGKLPDYSEMVEVRGFDGLPNDKAWWTRPAHPLLYAKMRKWLGLKNKDDELWDVYDENRKLTGRTHRRGDPLLGGDFHLVVRIWIVNAKDEILITRRSLRKKGHPGMWEVPSGSAMAGEDGLTAAIREAAEETGVNVSSENGEFFSTYRCGNAFFDSFLFRQDFDIANVVLQEGETIDAKAACFGNIADMMSCGKFVRCQSRDFNALKELLRGEKV